MRRAVHVQPVERVGDVAAGEFRKTLDQGVSAQRTGYAHGTGSVADLPRLRSRHFWRGVEEFLELRRREAPSTSRRKWLDRKARAIDIGRGQGSRPREGIIVTGKTTWRTTLQRMEVAMGLPTMLLLVASAAEAQFSPWVSQASITGDSQFAIYDRVAQALVGNPVYQHGQRDGDPVSQPAGVVNGTSVTVTVDLNGAVDIVDPILVKVRPTARIGKSEIPVTPEE